MGWRLQVCLSLWQRRETTGRVFGIARSVVSEWARLGVSKSGWQGAGQFRVRSCHQPTQEHLWGMQRFRWGPHLPDRWFWRRQEAPIDVGWQGRRSVGAQTATYHKPNTVQSGCGGDGFRRRCDRSRRGVRTAWGCRRRSRQRVSLGPLPVVRRLWSLEPRDGKCEIWKLRSAEIAGLGDFSRELVPGQMGVRKIPEEGRDFAE